MSRGLDRLLRILVAVMIVCALMFASLLARAHLALNAAPAAIADVGRRADAKANVMGAALNKQVADGLQQLRKDVFRRIDRFEGHANDRILDALGKVDNAIGVAGAAESDANDRLIAMEDQTQQIAKLSAPLQRILDDAAEVSRNHIQEKGNGNAWPVKITAMMGEFSKTSDSVRLAADQSQKLLAEEGAPTAKSVRDLSASIAHIGEALQAWVDRLTAPQSLKSQVKEWIKVVIAGASRIL